MASLALAFDVLARDKGASKTLDKVGDAAERTGKKGHNLGVALGAGLATAGVVVAKFAKDSIAAFKESEQSSAALDDALKRFPATADRNRSSFDKLNATLAKKTVFDDDATSSGQAVLAQYKLTGAQIQELTPLLQDYASKTGRDIPTAAGVLGKALQGKGKALADVGIKFKDAGSTGANFEQIVGGLRKQVGGFAEKEGKTAAGQAQILGNQYGELQETVGSKLVPILTKLAEKLLQIVDFISRNSAVIGPLAVILGTLGGTVFTIIKVTQAWTAVQAALNIVLSLNPIGLVVIAIAALVAGIILAWKHSETFRDVVKTVFNAVAGFVLKAIDIWLGAYEKLFRAMSHIPIIGDKFKAVADKIAGVRDNVEGLKDKLNELPAVKKVTIQVAVQAANAGIKSGALSGSEAAASVLNRVKRAGGGPVRAGQAYIVGEREPEWFVPDVSGRILNQQQAASGGGRGMQHNGDIIIQKADAETDPQAVSRALTTRAFLLGWT